MNEITDFLLKTPTGKSWKKIGIKTHHGINLSLSALHSANSCGIGDFFDLIPIIDWCQSLKIDFIQLLPLNNSNSETDPSPYNAVSSCAINFLHLSLHALPYLEKFPQLVEKLKEFGKLNETSRIDYAAVLAHKIGWLRAYFAETGSDLLKSKELELFINENNDWVNPYALFRVLKEHLENTSWKSWPEDLRYPAPEKLDSLYELYKVEISFYVVMQFLCYSQIKKIREYANLKGIFLMGDIPILLSSESADSWLNPELFDTHLAAGAPPDYYNPDGQNWGFPIFNWDAMRKSRFSWWKKRLSYAENFFDLFRIDHVIGFFRIWAIPPNHLSKDGYFIPENEKEWEPLGRELLNMIISSTSMLPIAEDLGTVPKVVRPILKELGISSTKVLRWERNYETDNTFIPFQHYPPISISCLSTHDSETLTLWWKNFKDEATAFANFKNWPYSPELTEKQREEILWDCHHTSSIFHVNLLQEYLALFPDLVWPDPEDERINVPGTISLKNWSYRFRPSVETIVSHQELFSKMKKILFSPSPPSVST